MPFAVVDFETTGILPSHHHRVVEVGVTHVEDDGSISGHWETLVNPQRDLGPQHIHGVRAADLIDAPLFEDIAADISGLLNGRTFVAHNAGFDIRFLVAEFSRAGLYFGDAVPHLCTMSLSHTLGVPGRGALDACCMHYGIPLVDAHSAGADSFATAQLLSAYMASTRHASDWRDYWSRLSMAGDGFPYPALQSRGVAWKQRGTNFSEAQHFLELISDPPLALEATVDEALYLDVLDRCLLDGVTSASESAQLVEVAQSLGLGRGSVSELHRRYFEALRHRAWADGVLTEAETAELTNVANLLRLDLADASLEMLREFEPVDSWAPTEFVLDPGAHVVLTGEMSVERSVWEERLSSAGYIPHPRITKQAKLLVAADPDSMSGKAKQARSYGIPVVGEEWLISRLGFAAS